MSHASIGYMNWFETKFVHNRPRWLLQRFWEIPILQSLGMSIEGKNVLEVGCGNGRAAREMVLRYGAKSVSAIDLDLGFVPTPHRAHAAFYDADATDMKMFLNRTFDVVVGFGLLHHVPIWQDSVAEIGRVLRPGGSYCGDDFTASGLKRWWHRVFDAPSENRFTTGQLLAEISKWGDVVDVTHRLSGDVVFWNARKR